MLGPLHTLRESVGRSSPQANLKTALLGIFQFHRRVVPGTAGLFAEPKLLLAYRDSLARQRQRAASPTAALADDIAAEQELGRIDSGVDARLASHLFNVRFRFFRAFMDKFSGRAMQPSWHKFATGLITAVVPQTVRGGREVSPVRLCGCLPR